MKKKLTSLYFICLLSLLVEHQAFSTNSIIIPSENINTYAVVIGISNYQDSSISIIKNARRDAELFTAWLHSASGGNTSYDNIQLLTNEEATLSRVAFAINDMFQKARRKDKVILYFAGYSGEALNSNHFPEYFYFYDTPRDALNTSSYPLMRHFSQLLKKRKNEFVFIGNMLHLLDAYDIEIGLSTRTLIDKMFIHQAWLNQKIPVNSKTVFNENSNSTQTNLNELLLDGLLGLADQNKDHTINFEEIKLYIDKLILPYVAENGLLVLSASSDKEIISLVNNELLNQMNRHSNLLLPSIIQTESSSKEQTIISQQTEKIKELYQNFIITIRLGHFLTPYQPNASSLLDTLLSYNELKLIHNDFRRKLIAGLQDETQQAINAYLNADSKEILRRNNSQSKYLKYPQYLQKSIDLMGKQNFMYKISEAKKFYFLGLNKRFEATVSKNNTLFDDALTLQFKGLDYEPDASFIMNEIGNIYASMQQFKKAKIYFEKAVELTPTWSIPYSNLCNISNDNPKDAITYGKKAVKINPKNAHALNSLGTAYLKDQKFDEAEIYFLKALKIEPKYSIAWYNMACIRSLEKDLTEAIRFLELAFYNGLNDPEISNQDADLFYIRSSDEYHNLLLKYFPEQFKAK